MRKTCDRRWMLLVGSCLSLACDADDDPGREPDAVNLGLYANLQDVSVDEANISLAFLAVREINEAGGVVIAGERRTLDLMIEDHGETGEAAAEATERFYDAGVPAVIGPPWSSHVLGEAEDHSDGAAAVAIKRGLVMVSQSATSPALTNLDDNGLIFRTMPSDLVQAAVAAEELQSLGFSTVSIIYRDDAYGRALSSAFEEEFESSGGSVLAGVPYDVSGGLTQLLSYSFNAELADVFAGGPEVVYLIAFEEFAQISARIAASGYADEKTPHFFATDAMYDINAIRSANEAVVRNLSGTAPAADRGEPGYERFLEKLQDAGLGEPWYAAPHLYDAIYLVAFAMQKADSTDPLEFRRAIREVSRDDGGDYLVGVGEFDTGREKLLEGQNIDYEGASGPLDLTAAGDPGAGWYILWSVVQDDGGAPVLDGSQSVEFGPLE